MRVHLDTDLAGDPDDVAALVYLLARDDVELTGITTVDDPGGRRAGYVAEVLRLAGRHGRAGRRGCRGVADHRAAVGRAAAGTAVLAGRGAARPGPLDAALDLLAASVAAGAVVVGIGPATTLAHAGAPVARARCATRTWC